MTDSDFLRFSSQNQPRDKTMVNFIDEEEYSFYNKMRIVQLRKERENALGDMERLAIDRELEKLLSLENQSLT